MDFMLEALKLAHIAYNKGEVPIGAVVVKNNKIIAKGYNTREKTQ
ncbi:MAG: deaminase, partial [Clostridia bacterium]